MFHKCSHTLSYKTCCACICCIAGSSEKLDKSILNYLSRKIIIKIMNASKKYIKKKSGYKNRLK